MKKRNYLTVTKAPLTCYCPCCLPFIVGLNFPFTDFYDSNSFEKVNSNSTCFLNILCKDYSQQLGSQIKFQKDLFIVDADVHEKYLSELLLEINFMISKRSLFGLDNKIDSWKEFENTLVNELSLLQKYCMSSTNSDVLRFWNTFGSTNYLLTYNLMCSHILDKKLKQLGKPIKNIANLTNDFCPNVVYYLIKPKINL